MKSSTHEFSFREDGDKGETTRITSLESQSQNDLLGRFDRLRETTQDNDKSTASVDTSAQNTVVISDPSSQHNAERKSNVNVDVSARGALDRNQR
jgi:hypothetical protein